MTETPASEDLAQVIELLPDNCATYGWDAQKALDRWAGTVYRTVREFWVDRANDTAGYIDLPNDGLPANELWTNAVAMLKYWDGMIATSEAQSDASALTGSFSRKIRRV